MYVNLIIEYIDDISLTKQQKATAFLNAVAFYYRHIFISSPSVGSAQL